MSGRIMRTDVYEDLQAQHADAMAELKILREGWALAASLFSDIGEYVPAVDDLQDDYERIQTRLNNLYASRMVP